MPITIIPLDGAKLQLTGDVATIVPLSSRAIREGFAVAISDGTLLRGSYDPKLRECRFMVAVEGSRRASVTRIRNGDLVRLSASIEWISIAAGSDALGPLCAFDAPEDGQLELAIGEPLAA